MGKTPRPRTTGVLQFLDIVQQRDWIKGETDLPDAGDRSESLEQRFKYAARFEKLLAPAGRRSAGDSRAIRSKLHSDATQDRAVLLVGFLLPSTSDKPLVRVNASWMELFTLYADGRISAPGSSCIFRISLRIVQPRRAKWTNPFSSKASRCLRTSVISSRVVRTFSASMCAALSRSANSSRAAPCCGPFGRST